MIKFTANQSDIIKCWQEAFGDLYEDILFFVNNVKDSNCLAFYDNDEIASMLYLVKCNLGYYIYAASTLNRYRSCGYMTELLNYCKNNYDSLCLIPADEGLIKYYTDRGFKIQNAIDDLKFNQIDEIEEYLFEGCSLSQPIVLTYRKDS